MNDSPTSLRSPPSSSTTSPSKFPFKLNSNKILSPDFKFNLQHHPSKLDLIDDTTLTSLPLPPPPPCKLQKRLSNASRTNSTTSIPQNKIFGGDEGGETESNYTTENSIQNSSSEEDLNTILDQPIDEDTFEDSEDPIVLIEDYMNKNTNDKPLFDGLLPNQSSLPNLTNGFDRKKSLANFKQRIYNKNFNFSDSISINSKFSNSKFSSFDSNLNRPNNKRTISNVTNDVTQQPSNLENWEAIFGKIPGTDQLKYCDLCEKPLYEISSIINNGLDHDSDEKLRTNSIQTDETLSHLNDLYSEFICWECIEVYEEFLNELYQNELSFDSVPSNENIQFQKINAISSKSTNSNLNSLLSLFKSIQSKYENNHHSNPSLKKKLSFSDDLMNKLYNLNNSAKKAVVDNQLNQFNKKRRIVDSDWVKSLQYKLRWRWRFNGLIPNTFNSNDNSVTS